MSTSPATTTQLYWSTSATLPAIADGEVMSGPAETPLGDVH